MFLLQKDHCVCIKDWSLSLFFIFFQVKELKNVYTTRVNVQVTAAQQNLDAAQSSLAEIRQKVMFLSVIHSSSK